MARDGIHLPSKKFSENHKLIFGKKKKQKKEENKSSLKSQWNKI
tara:strand:+ start:632 stop:763 length:132 start_codon:yes stop_codon:yes gene_type:complete